MKYGQGLSVLWWMRQFISGQCPLYLKSVVNVYKEYSVFSAQKGKLLSAYQGGALELRHCTKLWAAGRSSTPEGCVCEYAPTFTNASIVPRPQQLGAQALTRVGASNPPTIVSAPIAPSSKKLEGPCGDSGGLKGGGGEEWVISLSSSLPAGWLGDDRSQSFCCSYRIFPETGF